MSAAAEAEFQRMDALLEKEREKYGVKRSVCEANNTVYRLARQALGCSNSSVLAGFQGGPAAEPPCERQHQHQHQHPPALARPAVNPRLGELASKSETRQFYSPQLDRKIMAVVALNDGSTDRPSLRRSMSAPVVRGQLETDVAELRTGIHSARHGLRQAVDEARRVEVDLVSSGKEAKARAAAAAKTLWVASAKAVVGREHAAATFATAGRSGKRLGSRSASAGVLPILRAPSRSRLGLKVCTTSELVKRPAAVPEARVRRDSDRWVGL